MFAYMTGVVAEKGHNELVLETGGIGYQLICSMNTVQNAVSVGESMRVYTYLNVRQEGIDLFNEGQTVLAEDMPVIPMWYGAVVAGYSDTVTNVQFTPFSRVNLMTIQKS